MDLHMIERWAEQYAEARRRLRDELTALHDEVEAARRRRLQAIRERVVVAQAIREGLVAAIEDGRALFDKPRTRVLAGIKVGLSKQRGRVEIADEARTIALVRKLLPPDQAELLIRVRESVHKPGVYDLTAADLKRLGIAIGDDTDVIVVKPADDALDKLLAELLPDTEPTGDEE